MTTTSTSRRHRCALAVALTLAFMSGCGLPDGGVETVDSGSVPYHLLDEAAAPPTEVDGGPAPATGPFVFWVDDGDDLVPRASASACGEAPEDLVDALLGELAAGPADEFRDQGLATALPPESAVSLTAIQDAVAYVDLEPPSPISAARLPVAVAQVVLTVTSVPGVDRVALSTDGELVQVPVAGGALTTSPVSADDYLLLVPPRFQASGPFGTRSGLGSPCPG